MTHDEFNAAVEAARRADYTPIRTSQHAIGASLVTGGIVTIVVTLSLGAQLPTNLSGNSAWRLRVPRSRPPRGVTEPTRSQPRRAMPSSAMQRS